MGAFFRPFVENVAIHSQCLSRLKTFVEACQPRAGRTSPCAAGSELWIRRVGYSVASLARLPFLRSVAGQRPVLAPGIESPAIGRDAASQYRRCQFLHAVARA